MDKRSICILFLLGAFSALILTAPAPASADSILYASQDTYVFEWSPNDNFNENRLQIKSQSGYQRFAYLMFTFGTETVGEAYLLMYQTGAWSEKDGLVRMRCGEHTFDENVMTYNNRPDMTGWTALRNMWIAEVASRKYWAADITDIYNANLGKTMTFFLRVATSGTNVGSAYEDREGTLWNSATPPPYVNPHDPNSPAVPYIQLLDVADTTAPSVPADLQAERTGWEIVTLNWTASTDNVAVDGYRIYRDGNPTPIGTTWRTTFTDTGAVLNTAHTYTVTAVDYAGNESLHSVAAVAPATPPDTEPPSIPGDLTVQVACLSAGVTWTASTDNVEVAGYKVTRDGDPVADTTDLFYRDSNVVIGVTYTYTVVAYDGANNESDPASATGTIPPCFDGDEIVFQFDDGGDAVYTYTSEPRTFYTSATGTAGINHWLGPKIMGRDGAMSWSEHWGHNNYRYKFSDSDGGSLTIQTATPEDQGGEDNAATYIRTNDFGDFFKWSRLEDEFGKVEYLRGMMVEVEMDIVGDLHGWCAPWGPFPEVGDCPWTNDYGHQGSDWGTQYGDRAGLQFRLASGRNLPDPLAPPETVTSTGDGVAYWFSVSPNDIRNPYNDYIRIFSPPMYDHATFVFKDGKGLGLIPEDGTGAYPRDGIIQGDGNQIKLTVGAVSAGGNSEYWDIWVTRPSGETIHINPATCDWVHSPQNTGNAVRFGEGGHTFRSNYHLGGQSSMNSLIVGSDHMNMLWGTKYRSIAIRNDWDGEITYSVSRISELRELGVGSIVVIDDSGGNKIVTLDSTSMASNPPFFYYIQEEDRSSGVRIVDANSDPAVLKDQEVTGLTGVLGRDINGNLFIDVTDGSVSFSGATKTADPVGMSNITVGGGDVTNGSGVTNVGLLATVWGEVISFDFDGDYNVIFELDDGSGTPVKVIDLIYDGVQVYPNVGEYWTAIGPIVLEDDGAGGHRRVLITDSAREVK